MWRIQQGWKNEKLTEPKIDKSAHPDMQALREELTAV